jgi:hypothetical protein
MCLNPTFLKCFRKLKARFVNKRMESLTSKTGKNSSQNNLTTGKRDLIETIIN